MKIKTITCHNVYNYGASLQAHALMYYLRGLGHEVEIIDYMPEYIRKNLSLWAIGPRWNKNILIKLAFYAYVVPIRLMQQRTRKKFAEFNKRYLNLTRRYSSYEELCDNPPSADVVFCGSDQIWNTTINNGLDRAFYCDFMPQETVRVSYAASFSVSELPEKDKAFVKQELEKMDCISVREKSGLRILDDLGIDGGELVCDPVFLKKKEEWKSMCYTPKYKDYILVYDQENSHVIKDLAIGLKKKTGKKIVALKDLYPRRYADYIEAYTAPIDFISLISNADIVITNSFHCTAFSIIMERNFYVVPRTHQKVNSRMQDLLDVLHIKGHIVENYMQTMDAEPINYEEVKERLLNLKNQSVLYINRCLAYKKRIKNL